MKKATGFITLQRQIVDWEWYKDINTKCLFIHLLLTANYVDGLFKGITIKRGQLVTSIPHLSTDTGLTVQQTKTALNHLRLTGEITDEANHQYRIITIVKYDDYQKLTDKSSNDQPTTNRQNHQRLTDKSVNDQPQYNNNNNYNKENNITREQYRERSAKRFVPPSREEVNDFCLEAGIEIDVERFVDYYTSKGWMVGKSHMKDWKAAVRGWAARENKNSAPPLRPSPVQKKLMAQDYEQRDYTEIDERIKRDMERRIMEMRRRNNGEA